MTDVPGYVSMFTGVGGADLGFDQAGWQCIAQIEWNKDCQAVLAHHWPDVPKWWDVSDVNGGELPAATTVVFGSPCQDLSIAGRREGLGGSRSSLFFEALRIISEMREATDGRCPEFIVWENVPGALSSNGGRDFGAVLDALAECGAVDIGWRVLDAQFFGVPQRRRRVFVVADFAGRRAGEVFAESEGVRWDPAACFAP
jgi:DNA (cytosine-5)-methyltransferase 1